jgi:hypothetical protein
MATTTPNYGWAVPTSTDLVKDGATAIETLGDAIDASMNTALGTKKAGMVLLNTTSFSGVTSVSLPALSFTSAYTNYVLYVNATSSASVGLRFRFIKEGVERAANYYGGMMENLLQLSNGPLPALYLFHQTNDVVVACNYTRLLGEFSFGCLAPLGFLGCQQIGNTPRAYGSCGIQTLIENNNYPILFTDDIVQNGGPNCLADPPGHSLLSIYQRAKNAATFFAPLITEDSSCYTTEVSNVQHSFSIQPNPTSNRFSILSSELPVSLQIFNFDGRLVYAANQEALSANNFQVDHLPAGIYHISLQQKSGAKVTQKLMKISP